ncbi:hypothetical protein BGX38DRAFT_259389 [Terfezia claveryi]|nr:hypothetical protein BGX38DRAFT_1280768 [Terfezia claveryi]KAF8432373.1 hypothetical protein BGX38DRAFT_259389 [Terfezia claveryi]
MTYSAYQEQANTSFPPSSLLHRATTRTTPRMLTASQPLSSFHERILYWLSSVPEKSTFTYLHPHTLASSGGGRHQLKPSTYISDCPHSPPITLNGADMSTLDAAQPRKRPPASSIFHNYRRIPPQPCNPTDRPSHHALYVPSTLSLISTPGSTTVSEPTRSTSFGRLGQSSVLIPPPPLSYNPPSIASASQRPPSPAKSSPTKVSTTTSRYLRSQLISASPKVHLGNPYHEGNPAPNQPPSHVTSIVKRFNETIFGVGYIPGVLKPILEIHPSCTMSFFPPQAFSCMEPDVENAKSLLSHILSINSAALQLFTRNEDESSWYPIVRSILCGPPPSPASTSVAPNQLEDLIAYFTPKSTSPTIPLVVVCEAQTKLLDQALLPKLYGRSIANGKVAYVIQLNRRHPLLREVEKSRLGLLKLNDLGDEEWSVLDDVSVAGSPTVVPVELKGMSGEYGEGGYQVGIAGVALLTRMANLAGRVTGERGVNVDGIPPVPAVVVVGHVWFLHWMFMVEARADIGVDDGQDLEDAGVTVGEWEVIQMGPIYMGSTESVAETFRLCKVVEKLKEWAGESGKEGFFGMWRNLMVGGRNM